MIRKYWYELGGILITAGTMGFVLARHSAWGTALLTVQILSVLLVLELADLVIKMKKDKTRL